MHFLVKKKNIISTFIAIILFVTGVYLIFQPQINQMFARSATDQYKIGNISASQIQQNENNSNTEGAVQATKQSDNLSSKFSSDKKSLPVTGLISIPDVGINLPIFNSGSDDALMYGASNVRKTKMGEGNYSLASHYVFGANQEKRLFTPLSKVKKGTKVYLTDKSKIYTYEIEEIFDVGQKAVHVLDKIEDKVTITLITCADFEAEYRHIYRGELKEVKDYNDADETVKRSFEKEFNL